MNVLFRNNARSWKTILGGGWYLRSTAISFCSFPKHFGLGMSTFVSYPEGRTLAWDVILKGAALIVRCKVRREDRMERNVWHLVTATPLIEQIGAAWSPSVLPGNGARISAKSWPCLLFPPPLQNTSSPSPRSLQTQLSWCKLTFFRSYINVGRPLCLTLSALCQCECAL